MIACKYHYNHRTVRAAPVDSSLIVYKPEWRQGFIKLHFLLFYKYYISPQITYSNILCVATIFRLVNKRYNYKMLKVLEKKKVGSFTLLNLKLDGGTNLFSKNTDNIG